MDEWVYFAAGGVAAFLTCAGLASLWLHGRRSGREAAMELARYRAGPVQFAAPEAPSYAAVAVSEPAPLDQAALRATADAAIEAAFADGRIAVNALPERLLTETPEAP